MIGFQVYNRSQEPVLCSITKNTNNSGDPGWFNLNPSASETWNRSGWEDVHFKSKTDTREISLWINRGSPAVVNFNGFNKEITIENNFKPEASFICENLTDQPVYCCVSTNSGGDRSWFKIGASAKEIWRRSGWETVAFRDENDTQRKGIYINNKETQTRVEFHGFNKELVAHDAPDDFIAQEHYAEATAIADRSFAAQNSRASNPGGLTASVDKIDILESIATGSTVKLNDHNQIYTLALLINHLKYGLAEPAVVVGVDEEWVKVAAYTDEFDGIVVLGFPTKAIDMIAPRKTRPVVGTRLVAVSQFTARDSYHQGVQGDILTGPRSLNKWFNFHPLIAQFVTDDSLEPVWERHMSTDLIKEDLWGSVWEAWLGWKENFGPNYFRLGAPSRVKEVATHHVRSRLPPYTP